MSEMLTMKEVAYELSVSYRTVERLKQRGELVFTYERAHTPRIEKSKIEKLKQSKLRGKR